MDGSVVSSPGAFKAIVGVAIASASAAVPLLQEDFDQRVRHRPCVPANRLDVFIGQVARFISEQLTVPRNRNS